jgi:hypothetical protein
MSVFCKSLANILVFFNKNVETHQLITPRNLKLVWLPENRLDRPKKIIIQALTLCGYLIKSIEGHQAFHASSSAEVMVGTSKSCQYLTEFFKLQMKMS